jgi:transcriptional regulator of met regulon
MTPPQPILPILDDDRFQITGFQLKQLQGFESLDFICQAIRSRPAPSPQWTDEDVMKEIQDAFDRGVEAAELTIDMQKHNTTIRNATLDEL